MTKSLSPKFFLAALFLVVCTSQSAGACTDASLTLSLSLPESQRILPAPTDGEVWYPEQSSDAMEYNLDIAAPLSIRLNIRAFRISERTWNVYVLGQSISAKPSDRRMLTATNLTLNNAGKQETPILLEIEVNEGRRTASDLVKLNILIDGSSRAESFRNTFTASKPVIQEIDCRYFEQVDTDNRVSGGALRTEIEPICGDPNAYVSMSEGLFPQLAY